MKVRLFFTAFVAVLFSTLNGFSQEAKKAEDVTVFEGVLGTAKWAGFDYMQQLEKAKQGDYLAMSKLLEFSGTVDGAEALDHAVTCLELIPYCSDNNFAAALTRAKPKLKKVLLERLQLAQARTSKEVLRKPLSEWAPVSWAVLNGLPYSPIVEDNGECMNTKAQKSAGDMGSDTAAEKEKMRASMEQETAKPKNKQ